jgi:hypothetical protein
MECIQKGHDEEPDLYARVEIRDDVPRLVELGWRAAKRQREIQQKDLRTTQIAKILDNVYGPTVVPIQDGLALLNTGPEGSEADRMVRSLLEEIRAGKGKRKITPEFLQQVAAVYRAHSGRKPTQMVARTFDVEHRQASNYVQLARERGFLAPSTRGKASV